MKYKAIFFDRDGTLTFRKVMAGGFTFAPYKSVEQEMLFFKQWFLFTFEELGVTEKVQERADFLTEHLWYLKKQLWPDTMEVLEYFKGKVYKMGVISDSPLDRK